MIVNLQKLPKLEAPDGVTIKRALVCDMHAISEFSSLHFGRGWDGEVLSSLMQVPPTMFIATENGKLLGYACYDATAKDFFGPTGVASAERGRNIGRALLIRTLEAMRDEGYAYAIIGWVGDAAGFYRKTVGAEFIEGGEPQNSAYSRMIRF